VMRLTVLRGTNQVKVQKPPFFRKENDHPQIAPITQIP
jgi:hypothetical protein